MDETQLWEAEEKVRRKKGEISKLLSRYSRVYMKLYKRQEELEKERHEQEKSRKKVKRSKHKSSGEAAQKRKKNQPLADELIQEFEEAEKEEGDGKETQNPD